MVLAICKRIDTSNGQHATTLVFGLIIGKIINDYGFGMQDWQLDKTSFRMDGCSKKPCGRPMVIFFDGALPVLGLTSFETSQSTTMDTGSNALGEVCCCTSSFLQLQSQTSMNKLDLKF